MIFDSYWEREIAKHGAARYHPQTGEWEWTVPEVENESTECPSQQ